MIRTPLLRLPNDLAPLALECFECILSYCGDIPMEPDLTEVKCVYTVLMVSLENYRNCFFLCFEFTIFLFRFVLSSIVINIWLYVTKFIAS